MDVFQELMQLWLHSNDMPNQEQPFRVLDTKVQRLFGCSSTGTGVVIALCVLGGASLVCCSGTMVTTVVMT
eukprot:6050719-Amphidinium_carterae.1